MRRLLRQPIFWLIVQVIVLFGVFFFVFGFDVNELSDSASYLNYAGCGFKQLLSGERTAGYPLFLRGLHHFSPNLAILPYVQFMIFCAAVFFLYYSLRRYGFAAWTAVFAVSPLLYLRLVREYYPMIMTEILGVSLSLFSVGFLLLLTSRGQRRLSWVGLTASVFLTYQVRPAYLFLLPLIPFLTLTLTCLRRPDCRTSMTLGKLFAGMVSACFIPFLLFCGLRSVVVGHFGLVSFGGFNMVGITTQFLTQNIVQSLDPDLQPIARAIIELRDQKNLGPPDGKSMAPIPVFVDSYYNRYFQEGILSPIWEAARTKSQDQQGFNQNFLPQNNMVHVNRISLRLALSVLEARPGIHLIYYVKSFFYSLSFTIYVEGIITVLLLLLFLAHLLLSLLDQTEGLRHACSGTHLREAMEFTTIMTISVFFYLAKILLMILVEPPAGRYLMAAALFLPSMVSTALFHTLKRGFRDGLSDSCRR
jgi:hypothetical protein